MKIKVKMSKLRSVFLAAALLLTMLSGCRAGEQTPPPEGAEAAPVHINYGISNAWDALMPYNTVSGSNYARIVYDKIYDRLAYVQADGTCLPRGADSWESADEGYSIMFYLNQDAKFHDGTPVTGKDWARTFQMMTDPDCPTMGRTAFSVFAGTDENGVFQEGEEFFVELSDSFTMKLCFKEPVVPEEFLIDRNREFYVLPTHLLEDEPLETIMELDLWRAPVGSGPCKFVSEISGSTLTLEANKDYHLGAPGFDTMTIRVIDKANQLTALISGDLDYYAFGNAVSEENVGIAESAGFTVFEGTVPTTFFELMLNNETIGEKEVRQAISLALDRDYLARQNAGDQGLPAYSSQLPGSLYAEEAQGEGFRRDVDGARALVEAYYDGTTYVLACTSPRASLAAIIEQDLREVGIQVEILTVDSATLFSGMYDGDYDMAIASHTPNSLPLWFVGTRFREDNNLFRVQDLSGYLARITAIEATVDLGEKAALVNDLEDYLGEELPFVPLWFTTSLYIESKTVEGIDYPSSSFSNENVWDWVKS